MCLLSVIDVNNVTVKFNIFDAILYEIYKNNLFFQKKMSKIHQEMWTKIREKKLACNADIARAADGGGPGPVPAGEHQQSYRQAAAA